MFSGTLKRLPQIQTLSLTTRNHVTPRVILIPHHSITPSRCFSSTPAYERIKKKGNKKPHMQSFRIHSHFNENPEDVQFAVESGEVPARRPKPPGKHHLFHDVVLVRFARLAPANATWDDVKKNYGSYGIKDMEHYLQERVQFRHAIDTAMKKAAEGYQNLKDNAFYCSLRQDFVRGGIKGLAASLRYAFQMFLFRDRFTTQVTRDQMKLADLRFPWEWYPATRAMQRTVHLHVGPTNSGKTYHALKALEDAKSGIYCGPLRLLAHEIYTRFQAKGKPCALLTGEEQKIPQDVDEYFISCTVEMTPLQKPVDVAVIDEIQMISDMDRGSGWTSAFLGIQAKEVHLCGEDRTVKIIQSLCQSIGDKCIVHRYKRLTPLKAAETTISKDYSDLEKGDCIVAFSRMNLHIMKKEIEEKTGKLCAIIYGSLPPEVRAQQASLFNEPDNDYDFLVASDAIGMGLNLEIKRVIFESVFKNDGHSWRELNVSELRQIGGRAGRFKTARQEMANDTSEENKVGLVTAMVPSDLKVVQKKLWMEPEPINSVMVFPPVSVIEKFSNYFPPNTSLKFILLRMRELASITSRFKLFIKDELLEVADIIQHYDMPISDRCVLLTAPAYLRDPNMGYALKAVARAIANGKGGGLLEMPEIFLTTLDFDLETLDGENSSEYLKKLESLHGSIVLYLWVSYRFPHIFCDQKMAFKVRETIQLRINHVLSKIKFTEEQLEQRRSAQRAMARNKQREKEELLDDEADESTDEPAVASEEGIEEEEEEEQEEEEEVVDKEIESAGFDDAEPVEVETEVLVDGRQDIEKKADASEASA